MKYIVNIVENFLVSLSNFISGTTDINIPPPEVQKLVSREIQISITLSSFDLGPPERGTSKSHATTQPRTIISIQSSKNISEKAPKLIDMVHLLVSLS